MVYDYLKNTLYGELPEDLQSVIIDTRVISGYGCVTSDLHWENGKVVCDYPDNNGVNYKTIDKLYLLSATEVYGNENVGYGFHDTAENCTSQFDYYKLKGVHTMTGAGTSGGDNLNEIIKYYYWYEHKINSYWWLRSANSTANINFGCVSNDGRWTDHTSTNNSSVSPAFRIG